MKNSDEERRTFAHSGTVRWDSTSQALIWAWQSTVPTGYVVYLMLIDGDVKKAGIAKESAASVGCNGLIGCG